MKLPRGAQAVVAASVAGGALTVLIAARWSRPESVADGQWVIAAVVASLALGSMVWPIVVFRDGESEAFTMDEVLFTILALLVPPLLTLGAFFLATAVAEVIRRRSLPKSAFNVGQVVIATGLGLAVSRTIAPPEAALTVNQVVAVVLGVGVYFAANTVLVAAVMAPMGTSWREFVTDLRLQTTLAGGGALTGVIAALAIHTHLWTLALVIPGLIMERQLISARFAALHDRARIQGLYEATLEANRRLRKQAVIDSILESVRHLLRSPQARLAAADPGLAELAVSMTVAGEQQWLVASGRRRDEPFDDADSGLLRALAAVGSGALNNAELYQQVHVEQERLASITQSLGEGVCAIGPDGRLSFVNPAAAAMIELPDSAAGTTSAISAGRTAPDFLLFPAQEAMRTGRTIRDDDARFRRAGGGTIPVAYTASAVMSDGAASGAVVAFRDITERKAFEDELQHHAFHDSLTGLANRRLLVERLEQAVHRSEEDGKTHGLIFIDVDRFKSINDSLGHVTGDELLAAIAVRMEGVVSSHDMLARIGGDEFVLLLENIAGELEAVAAARRICAVVEQPMVLSDGYELVASVSLGIALTQPGKTADDVLRDADVAMYEAKGRCSGGYKVFDSTSMGTRSAERLEIESALRKGLDRDELEVHYQPLYSLDSHQIVGAEALVRWRHPVLGLMSPSRFVPIAEETGLIMPLGRHVMETACRQVRAIRDRLHVDLPISVNLSSRQFAESGLLSQVAAALDATGLPSELLTFEITETMVMEDLAGAREIMKKLSRLGVRLAIDDFGTGHSSLAYLKQFPVHEVKVDRGFVQCMVEDPVDSAIVRAIIDLANAMRIAAVAEGVETPDQVAGLKLLGCQFVQGNYFSHPLRADEFDELLASHFDVGSAVPRRPG